ncbi:MAG: SPFH domain-containing protein [Ardenticatenaceae bacterium]|nr:SPFH domain-containing protein [Ardenticatenaceae bacterium]
MFKTFLPLMMIFGAAGLIWGGAVGAVTAVLSLSLFAVWAVRRWVYVNVPELETAVVYHTDSQSFARFLAPGRHWIMPLAEKLGESISTASAAVTGQCADAETTGGIPLTIDWQLSYKLNPFRIPADNRPKLARSLPFKAATIARGHVNNCIRHVIGDYPVEALNEPGMIKRLEREVRQLAAARLADMGFEVSRVMLGPVTMPSRVRTALAEAYEQQVRTEHEAQSLARLHQVISQFSEADVQRLLELERIYKLGENGVTLLYHPAQYVPPTPPAARNGRRQANPIFTGMMPPDAAVVS